MGRPESGGITSCMARGLVVTSIASDGGVDGGRRLRAADKVLMEAPYSWNPRWIIHSVLCCFPMEVRHTASIDFWREGLCWKMGLS